LRPDLHRVLHRLLLEESDLLAQAAPSPWTSRTELAHHHALTDQSTTNLRTTRAPIGGREMHCKVAECLDVIKINASQVYRGVIHRASYFLLKK
jgi:hypothetical protein